MAGRGGDFGIANGAVRELVYRPHVSPLAAHQISTAIALVLFTAYFWRLDRRRPIPDLRTALEIGGIWFVLTVLFEFGFGRYGDGKTWPELLEQYDVSRGYVWSLVLVWLTFGPAVVRWVRRGR